MFAQARRYLLPPANTPHTYTLAYIFIHPLTLTLYEAPEKMDVLVATFQIQINLGLVTLHRTYFEW